MKKKVMSTRKFKILAFQQMEVYSAIRGWEESGAGGIMLFRTVLVEPNVGEICL